MCPRTKLMCLPPTVTSERIPHSQRAWLNFRPHLLSSPVQVFIKRRKYALKIAVYALKVSLNILIMQDRAIKTRRDHPIRLPLASALTLSCSCMSQPPTTFPKARSHTHPQPSVTAEANHIRVTRMKSVCVCVCVCVDHEVTACNLTFHSHS